MTNYIFVYGTLMRGHGNHPLMEMGKDTEYVGPGSLPGFRMYHLGGFPGITPSGDSSDVVSGEIYRVVNPDVMVRLDRLEGVRYDKDNNSCGLYHKRSGPIGDDDRGTFVDAYYYEYNGTPHPGCELVDGVWRY